MELGSLVAWYWWARMLPATIRQLPQGEWMTSLEHALQGAQLAAPMASVVPLSSLLVLGAGGTLGSALLGEALVAGRFAQVQAVVEQPLASALRGLVPLPTARLQSPGRLGADSALIVFERERHSNGRDAAFVQPVPADLLPLSARLRAGGVRRLVKALGLSWQKTRPRHPKADPAAQGRFETGASPARWAK